ncbi:hypothetical protein AcetOrient_orf03737 [Acetobacter orientalis]|uniref:Uncharacterized protein n=1 Tax=Acetobacter orientalis TaxID=146474 RepID=A0A2Z5ZKG1_9PROT|nr:hypothetical protein AcetOrient_orf03737 [Acetobacter orientalis]
MVRALTHVNFFITVFLLLQSVTVLAGHAHPVLQSGYS